jgi:hypothetical protein
VVAPLLRPHPLTATPRPCPTATRESRRARAALRPCKADRKSSSSPSSGPSQPAGRATNCSFDRLGSPAVGPARERLDSSWDFGSGADLEAVIGIEFDPEHADLILAEHPDTTGVDYAVDLWWRRY